MEGIGRGSRREDDSRPDLELGDGGRDGDGSRPTPFLFCRLRSGGRMPNLWNARLVTSAGTPVERWAEGAAGEDAEGLPSLMLDRRGRPRRRRHLLARRHAIRSTRSKRSEVRRSGRVGEFHLQRRPFLALACLPAQSPFAHGTDATREEAKSVHPCLDSLRGSRSRRRADRSQGSRRGGRRRPGRVRGSVRTVEGGAARIKGREFGSASLGRRGGWEGD